LSSFWGPLQYHQREEYSEQRKNVNKDIGQLENQVKDAEAKLKKKNERLESALEKENQAKEINKKREFCVKALNIVIKTKNDVMQEIREKIESKTQEQFLDMVWKKETFRSVEIDLNYHIKLIHSLGFECLGTVSAGERALLALAFTLSLHEVSGFDSPILIDTPVARISGKNRENFGKIFSSVSDKKQTILLFTPDEYTKSIGKYLDNKASSRQNINLSIDETVSTLEVL